MKITRILSLSLALMTPALFSQSAEDMKALRKEVEAIKEGQKAIQSDLEAIKKLLTQPAQQGFKEAVISVEGSPFKGEKNAKVTLVEFSDYQCPFCARHVQQTVPQLMKEYVSTGKLKYVFRDYPIESIHPQAFKAAEAARCGGEQGKFWEMHDILFDNQKQLQRADLDAHAQKVGLDAAKFKDCLDSGRQANRVRLDFADGGKAGARGTPGFFLGLTQPNEPTVKAVKFINGAQPYAQFKEAIDALLAQAK